MRRILAERLFRFAPRGERMTWILPIFFFLLGFECLRRSLARLCESKILNRLQLWLVSDLPRHPVTRGSLKHWRCGVWFHVFYRVFEAFAAQEQQNASSLQNSCPKQHVSSSVR